ncbi:hypothetical protein B0H14DRAFT_3100767 [Mycena olivaceomarginata]|nr:hypothetical protein B0H14DRAFT_3100767 [Mycena olivaceomarginata]
MTVLFTPLDVGDIIITNRISEDECDGEKSSRRQRVPNNAMKKYYLQRALGGAGLIVTEATLISPQGAQYDRSPGIWNMQQVAGWRNMTNVVHLTESKIYCQPNEVPDPTILKLFKDTAKNAKLAGFNGVECKLISGWGGDCENCARFGLEVLKSLVEVFDCNFSLKISPGKGGYNDIGMPLDDTVQTFSYFLSEADKLKSLYIMLSRYIPHLDPMINDSDPKPGKERGTPHDPVSTYTKLIHNAKNFVVGGVTPEEAEELVKPGEVDGAFFGMSRLTHLDLAKCIRHSKRMDNMAAMSQLYGGANVDG